MTATIAIGALAAKSLRDRNKLAGVNNHEFYATLGVAAVANLYASGLSSMVARGNIRSKYNKLDNAYKESGGGR